MHRTACDACHRPGLVRRLSDSWLRPQPSRAGTRAVRAPARLLHGRGGVGREGLRRGDAQALRLARRAPPLAPGPAARLGLLAQVHHRLRDAGAQPFSPRRQARLQVHGRALPRDRRAPAQGDQSCSVVQCTHTISFKRGHCWIAGQLTRAAGVEPGQAHPHSNALHLRRAAHTRARPSGSVRQCKHKVL